MFFQRKQHGSPCHSTKRVRAYVELNHFHTFEAESLSTLGTRSKSRPYKAETNSEEMPLSTTSFNPIPVLACSRQCFFAQPHCLPRTHFFSRHEGNRICNWLPSVSRNTALSSRNKPNMSRFPCSQTSASRFSSALHPEYGTVLNVGKALVVLQPEHTTFQSSITLSLVYNHVLRLFSQHDDSRRATLFPFQKLL